MNNIKHKNLTILSGVLLLATLLVNLIRILTHNPSSFIKLFKLTEEIGLPWIAYISISTWVLSAIGALGLIKYRQWGFYSIYFAYLVSLSVVSFPFAPGFLFQFTSGIYKGVITLIVLFTALGFLIYLHVIGKKNLFFIKSNAI